MKSVAVQLSDDRAIVDVEARAAANGLTASDYIKQEIRRVIHEVRDLDQMPPVTKRFAGIASEITDVEFREFRRGYLTRKYESYAFVTRNEKDFARSLVPAIALSAFIDRLLKDI